MNTRRWNTVACGVASIVIVVTLVACSKKKAAPVSPSPPDTHPDLVAAAKARLSAQSSGLVAGDATTASSLSSGDIATADQASAKRIGGQIAAGDTSDYGFDVLSVAAYPLDGGESDFMAFETGRTHDGGGVFREVELYHRDTAGTPWKSVARSHLNDNIDLPQLKLDGNGRGQLLTEAAINSQQAQPSDLANRYASAMNDGSVSGRLAAGSFVPSQATTGVIVSATQFLSTYSVHGSSSVHWTPRPGGHVVALTDGVLVFSSVQEIKNIHRNIEGTSTYFVTQDPKRLGFGGLLAPGNYGDVNQTFLVDIAVVVRTQDRNVVAQDSTLTATTGMLARLQ